MINWFALIKRLTPYMVSGSILWRYISKSVLGGHYSIPRGCPVLSMGLKRHFMLKSDRGYLDGEETVLVSQPRHRLCTLNRGCVRLGNPNLDFQNLNPDFPIEREIRKRFSPPRNPSSGWNSIKKSKSGFFPFYRSIGKSEKGFAKLFSWTASGLLFANYASAGKTGCS